MESYSPGEESKDYVMVEYDGTVTLFEPVIYTVYCQVDMYLFPYDTQYCVLRWASWEFTLDKLNMV